MASPSSTSTEIGAAGEIEDLAAKRNRDHAGFRRNLVAEMVVDEELDHILREELGAHVVRPAARLRRLRPSGYPVTHQGKRYDVLGGRQYQDLRTGSLALLRRFPPGPGRVYVGIGQTSSAVLGFLEHLGGITTAYVPADGLGDESGRPPSDLAVDDLFNSSVPAGAWVPGTTFVLFHGADGEAVLERARALLKGYLARRRGVDAEVGIALFSSRGRATAGVPLIDTTRLPDLEELSGEIAGLIGVRRNHHPGKRSTATMPTTVRPEFLEFTTRLGRISWSGTRRSRPSPARPPIEV